MERARSPSAYVLAVPPVKLTSGDAVSVACAAERAEKFACAPKVHAAVLLWPHWSIEAG
jgi:hypothetical protein